MVSEWGALVPPAAVNDVSQVVDSLLAFTRLILDAHGEVVPQGAGVTANGSMRGFAVSRSALDPVEQLREVTAAAASDLRAVGVSAPIVGSSAVRLEIEHRVGAALVVVAPYTRGRRTYSFGDLAVSAGMPRVWPSA